MPIVGGMDIHRKQITFDYLDLVTGEVQCGQIAPADRRHLRAWLQRFAGVPDVAFAFEACTGWRYVAEESRRPGCRRTWPSRPTPRRRGAARRRPRPTPEPGSNSPLNDQHPGPKDPGNQKPNHELKAMAENPLRDNPEKPSRDGGIVHIMHWLLTRC